MIMFPWAVTENCSVLINRRQTITHEWNEFLCKMFIKNIISSIQCDNLLNIFSYPDKARSNYSYHIHEMSLYVSTSHKEHNVHVPLKHGQNACLMMHAFLWAGIKWGLLVNFGPTFFCSDCAEVSIGYAILPSKNGYNTISMAFLEGTQMLSSVLWVELGPSHL